VRRSITPKQMELLEAIHRSVVDHKMGPTTSEIATTVGCSPGNVVYKVMRLEILGLITKEHDKSGSFRSMRLTPKAHKLLGICDPETALDAILKAFDSPSDDNWEKRVNAAIELGRKSQRKAMRGKAT
jgi:DNA-binding MarR family transcriptional regulator